MSKKTQKWKHREKILLAKNARKSPTTKNRYLKGESTHKIVKFTVVCFWRENSNCLTWLSNPQRSEISWEISITKIRNKNVWLGSPGFWEIVKVLLFGGPEPIRVIKLFLLHSGYKVDFCLVFIFCFPFVCLLWHVSDSKARQSGGSWFHSPSLLSSSCH